MSSRPATRAALAVFAAVIVVFLLAPIALILLYAFNPSNVQSWPLGGLSTRWFASTWHNDAMRQALWLSVRAALIATAIALALGSTAAFAVHRFRFFGRDTISLVLVLPLALPGIITGMALNSFFTFSLTLGDFITPTLVGGAGSDFIGNVVYRSVGVSNDVPFAAAFAVVPVVVMGLYLLGARRAGAFEAL